MKNEYGGVSAGVVAHQVGTTSGRAGQPPLPVTAYTLTSDELTVEVWNHGARLVSVFSPDRHGELANVLLRHPTLADYDGSEHAYFGATIGRYANRIAHGRFRIGNQPHQLAVNEGPHQLHGGSTGLDRHVWETVDARDGTVTFRHFSSDNDQGFPGNATVDVTYRVVGAQLTIDTTAASDADTVFGTTNHAYWNLAGRGTIIDHELHAPARRVVEVDNELIPTGKLVNVAGGQFDFSTVSPLSELVDSGGVDHCLVYDVGGANAMLHHPGSGRKLRITSDQPGMQVYTGQYLPLPFAGLCLEPQQLPDTPNRPDFGSALLRVGDTYRHRTVYTFGVLSA